MKNVLFLAFDFPPFGGAGVHRSLKFVKYLPEFGWDPTVVTVRPGYKKHEIYDNTLLDDHVQPVKVVHVPFPPSLLNHIMEKPGRIYSLLRTYVFVFPDLFSPWGKAALSEGQRQLAKKSYQVIFSTILPVSTGIAGIRLSRQSGVPLVADFRDTISSIRFFDYPTRLHFAIAKHYERRIIRYSARSIMQDTVVENEMKRRYPRFADKIVYIPNGYDENDFRNIEPKPPGRKFRFVYCGSYNIGASSRHKKIYAPPISIKSLLTALHYTKNPMDRSTEAPDRFFDAVAVVRKKRPDIYDRMEILFVGARKAYTEEAAIKRGINDIVHCTGYVSHDDAVGYMMSADALILTHFKPLDSPVINCVPGKTFEYIRSCRPVLAMVPQGDAHDIMTQSRLGLITSQTDIDQISRNVCKLVLKKNVKEYEPDISFIRRYDRKRLTGRLADIFNDVSAGYHQQ